MIYRRPGDSVTAPEDHRQWVDGRREIFGMGLRSLLSIGLVPLGKEVARFHRVLAARSRSEHGLIIILPGIDGCSTVNDSIARGLVAARLQHAVRIIDWRKHKPWNPFHLVMERHNRNQARVVADIVTGYQRDYPGQPVHLIGHSAGAGIALFALERLDSAQPVTSVILMAAAVSRSFDVTRLLDRTRRGIWNFYSPLDLATGGLGTLVFGTMDRRYGVSAGVLGFHPADVPEPQPVQDGIPAPRLHQIRFRMDMLKSWNLGGHFGWTNAVFVQRYVAPICQY